MRLSKFKEIFLMLILLFFSGNPVTNNAFGKLIYIVALFLTILTLGSILLRQPRFNRLYFRIAFFLCFIFFFQWIILDYVSWPADINLLARILVGGLILFYFKERFGEIFLKVLFPLCLISLIFYVIINIAKVSLPKIELNPYVDSYFLVYLRTSYQTEYRNMGMFWEPGAYSGIITLCLAINFNNLEYIWKKHRAKLIIIIIALLTTLSTGGYAILFVIIIFYLIKIKNKLLVFLLLPMMAVAIFYLYNEVDFLGDKISGQFDNASNQRVGEYSNDRIGSIIFDYHYIKKHPIIGNGFDNRSRYADDPEFMGADTSTASGNSFSGYMASMGIIFVLGYFVLLYKAFGKSKQLYVILILIVVFLNLQDEQWYGFPLYLGLPFIDLQFNKFKYISRVFGDQSEVVNTSIL